MDDPAEIAAEFFERSQRARVLGTGIPEPFEIHTEIQKLEGEAEPITRPEEETRPPVQPTLAPPPPVVESVDPAVGDVAGGAVVDIHGTGFLDIPTLKVYFGEDTPATNVTWVSSTKLTVTVPAGSAGFADVTVEHLPGIEDTLPASFHYVAAPVITSVEPPYGDVAGGYVVNIHGSGFLDIPTLAVFIGGNSAGGVTYVNSTLIAVTAPAGSEGATVLSVEHVSGGSLANIEFRYQTAPSFLVWVNTGPDAVAPHHHPWGFFVNQTKLIQIHAWRGAGVDSNYQGSVQIMPTYIGPGVSYNAYRPDLVYPFPMVNGEAWFFLTAALSGPPGNQSFDLKAQDAVYPTLNMVQNFAVGNDSDPH